MGRLGIRRASLIVSGVFGVFPAAAFNSEAETAK